MNSRAEIFDFSLTGTLLAIMILTASLNALGQDDVIYQQSVKLNTSWSLRNALDCGHAKGMIIVTKDSVFLEANECKNLFDKRIPISSIEKVRRAWWMISPHTTVIKTRNSRIEIFTYRRKKMINAIRDLLET